MPGRQLSLKYQAYSPPWDLRLSSFLIAFWNFSIKFSSTYSTLLIFANSADGLLGCDFFFFLSILDEILPTWSFLLLLMLIFCLFEALVGMTGIDWLLN